MVNNRFQQLARRGAGAPLGAVKEFLTFLQKGNVIQLAIAVVMGIAFNDIVKSIVANIFNPILGLIGTGQLELLFVPLTKVPEGKTYASPAAANADKVTTLNYGAVISAIITFIIVSLFCFLLTKAVLSHFEKEPEVAAKDNCKYCMELVNIEAKVCPFCQSKQPIEMKEVDEPVDLSEGLNHSLV